MLPRFTFGLPSVGDTLLANCYGAKIELLRYTGDDAGDDELTVSYELRGEVPADVDAAGMLAGLIAALSQPREGGEAHA